MKTTGKFIYLLFLGFVLAGQVLYHLSQASRPLALSILVVSHVPDSYISAAGIPIVMGKVFP
jgi:hypothetical protein